MQFANWKENLKTFAKNLKPTLDVHISKLRNNRQITVIHGSEKVVKERIRGKTCVSDIIRSFLLYKNTKFLGNFLYFNLECMPWRYILESNGLIHLEPTIQYRIKVRRLINILSDVKQCIAFSLLLLYLSIWNVIYLKSNITCHPKN